MVQAIYYSFKQPLPETTNNWFVKGMWVKGIGYVKMDKIDGENALSDIHVSAKKSTRWIRMTMGREVGRHLKVMSEYYEENKLSSLKNPHMQPPDMIGRVRLSSNEPKSV